MTADAAREEWWAMTVRPYTLTGGRTRSPVMNVEAMISINPGNPTLPDNLFPELYQIMDLAQEAMSVAEVSAYLSLPLQVTKVLIGDLVSAGHLLLHTARGINTDHRPELELLDRVLEGLQKL